MDSINIDSIHPQNKHLAQLINDLAEILSRESMSLYKEFVNEICTCTRTCTPNNNTRTPETENMILRNLYTKLLDCLRQII